MSNNPLGTTSFSQQDTLFMEQAIALGRKGIYSAKPNPAVGCVLVKAGEIVGQGWHEQAGLAHAERVALAQAGDEAEGATAYVTLEPCSHFGKTPPCADGLIAAKIAKVIVAMMDPNPLVSGKGVERLIQAGIEVKVGLLESEARALNLGFISRMQNQLPFVRLKMASSLDGRTAMQNGESHWITGPESRIEVHKMRAQSGALVTGIGTVLADNPSLTVRLTDAELNTLNLTQESCHPIRVVLDPNLSMPAEAKMLSLPGRTIVMTSKETAEHNPAILEMLNNQGAEIVAVAAKDDHLDIESVLHYLAEVEQVNDVMVESGAIVAGSFVQSGLVGELHSFVAPCLMGNAAKPMFVLPGMESMKHKINLTIQSIEQFGEDVRLVLVPKSKG